MKKVFIFLMVVISFIQCKPKRKQADTRESLFFYIPYRETGHGRKCIETTTPHKWKHNFQTDTCPEEFDAFVKILGCLVDSNETNWFYDMKKNKDKADERYRKICDSNGQEALNVLERGPNSL